MYLKYRKNVYSQNGEDGVIGKLLEDLKIKNNITACEFGAWDGKHYSNTYNLVSKCSKLLMIEGDEIRFQALIKTSNENSNIIPVNKYVTTSGKNCLDEILKDNNFPSDFDILSIDTDTNDLDIWESLKNFTPKIVIIEINSRIPPGILQRHNPRENKYQNSFSSTAEVGNEKFYTPICHTGNLIFLKNDLLSQIKFKKELINNPNNIFIKDWIKSKSFFINKLRKLILRFKRSYGLF